MKRNCSSGDRHRRQRIDNGEWLDLHSTHYHRGRTRRLHTHTTHHSPNVHHLLSLPSSLSHSWQLQHICTGGSTWCPLQEEVNCDLKRNDRGGENRVCHSGTSKVIVKHHFFLLLFFFLLLLIILFFFFVLPPSLPLSLLDILGGNGQVLGKTEPKLFTSPSRLSLFLFFHPPFLL